MKKRKSVKLKESIMNARPSKESACIKIKWQGKVPDTETMQKSVTKDVRAYAYKASTAKMECY